MHPILLPTKTPPLVQTRIVDLITSLQHDFPDLTPCRFLQPWHTFVINFH